MQSQSVDEGLPALVRNQGDKYVCNPQLGSSQRPLFFYNRHTQAFSPALPLVRSRHLEAKKLIKKISLSLSSLTFTFRQGASGFRPQSMGKLDTQLVAMDAGGF